MPFSHGSCAPSAKTRFHVGCSGWFYWHWKGLFYPEDLSTHKWFAFYARRFKTVEINASFYRWPRPENVRGWVRQSPAGFRYSVKANRLITHEKRFRGTKRLIADFCQIAEWLGPKMGCFLFQLPPSFTFSSARLGALVNQLDPRQNNAVEFRHPSWWRDGVFRAFEGHNLAFCAVSAPRLPEDLVRTGDLLYVRFHGRQRWYGDEYSEEELTRWAASIRQSGAREAWIYFNNDRQAHAVRNARLMARLLKRSDEGVAVPLPAGAVSRKGYGRFAVSVDGA